MVHQQLVQLLRAASDLCKVVQRHRRKIVVFVVVSNIEVNSIRSRSSRTQNPSARKNVNRRVESDLNHQVQHNPTVEHADFLQTRGSGNLKNRKQQQPESLPDGGIPDQPGFPITGQVGIEVVDPLK